jgi:hypothetical protein
MCPGDATLNRRRFLQEGAMLPAAAVALQGAQKGRSVMRIAVGSDHAGFPLKGTVLQLLKSWKHTIKDCGSFTPDPVDFPDVVALVAAELKSGRAARASARPSPAIRPTASARRCAMTHTPRTSAWSTTT